MTMNTISPDILWRIHPANVEEIWRKGDYSSFYQGTTMGSSFLDIAVRFWDNDRERVASVGTAIHQIIDGEEHDMMQSVVLHRDGHITSLDYTWKIIPGYIGIITLHLLLNPRCLSHNWIPVDKDVVIENQESISTDISREDLAGNIWTTQLPPLEETNRFSQLRRYMDKLSLRYIAGSNLPRTP